MFTSKITNQFINTLNNFLSHKVSKDIRIKNETTADYLSDKDCSNKFSEYFSSVFRTETDSMPEFHPLSKMHTVTEDVCFNCDDIIKAIQNLKNTICHGRDNVSYFGDNVSYFLVKKLAL